MGSLKQIAKQELVDAVDAFAENADLMAARLRVLEERMAGANAMIEKIDHLIVRMNGQSTPYRDELESIVTEYGFWVRRGEATSEGSLHAV